MKKILRYCILTSFVSIFPAAANAAFTYQNKPISPDCIAKMLEQQNAPNPVISLSTCSTPAAAAKVHLEDGVYTNKQKNEVELQPFGSYTILGTQDNKFLISFGQWTGGSGFFSNVIWLSKDDQNLTQLKILAGGDRCNGGVDKAALWEYTSNMTSADLIQFANDDSFSIEPYKDLDASAIGCVAKAYYHFDSETQTANFEYVKLDVNFNQSPEWTKEFKYQACFNQLIKKYIKDGRQQLRDAGVKAFAAEFKKTCMS